MISDFLSAFRKLNNGSMHAGADEKAIRDVEAENGFVFPEDYIALLRATNGVEGYNGYYRLFGVRNCTCIESHTWNDRDCWKFAWGQRCSAYWCFGETAWGDQYAFSLEALQMGSNSSVYWLDAMTMDARIVSGSFSEFLMQEFLRSAEKPYDEMTVEACNALGPIECQSNLVYVPSLLLGGTESIANLIKMPARAAMICNGDVAIQFDEATDTMTLKGIETYEDEMKRTRLKLVWDEA